MGKRTCDVSGCDRPHLARGYCNPHWQRWSTTGDPGPAQIRQRGRRCTVEGCDRAHYAHDYCGAHLRRFRRSGDPGRAEIVSRPQTCTVAECSDQHSAQGYCSSHYARFRRTGDAGPAFTVRRRDPRERDERGRKQCRVCDDWLPESAFTKYAPASDGRTPRCKDCHHAAFTVRRYGVAPDWYAKTLRAQGGGCAVCGAPPGRKRLHVDHDHSHCAKDRACPVCVRGLLCGGCNMGIGHFRESPDLLRRAAAYLGR